MLRRTIFYTNFLYILASEKFYLKISSWNLPELKLLFFFKYSNTSIYEIISMQFPLCTVLNCRINYDAIQRCWFLNLNKSTEEEQNLIWSIEQLSIFIRLLLSNRTVLVDKVQFVNLEWILEEELKKFWRRMRYSNGWPSSKCIYQKFINP